MSRYHNLSRLVIIAQKVDKYDEATTYSRTKINKQDEVKVRRHLIGLLNKLLPKACTGGVVDCNFLRYEEELVFSEQIVAYHMVGSNDKYKVLNVQVDIPGDTNINFRRRLRYKSLPNVIQAECIIVARDHDEKLIKNVNLRDLSGIAGVTHVVDTSKLVNPSLQMMVSGLSLVEKLKDGEKVNSLCLGVKGGVLMKFLIDVLGFKVVVVEKEQSVIDAAKYYFKLEEHEDLDVIQYDEEKFMERIVGGIGALASIFLFSQRVETNL